MGMFLQSVSFRRPQGRDWGKVAGEIQALVESFGLDAVPTHLEEERPFYCVLSPYGDFGTAAEQLAQKISAITGDYAISAMCVDSDFNELALYSNGTLLDKGYNGEPYEEYAEFGMSEPLHLEAWKPLLLDPTQEGDLEETLFGDEIFAEDLLRKLTKLTGFPVLDDELLMETLDF